MDNYSSRHGRPEPDDENSAGEAPDPAQPGDGVEILSALEAAPASAGNNPAITAARNLPRICLPPSDTRSNVLELAWQHFGMQGSIHNKRVALLAKSWSALAMASTLLVGSIRFGVRRAVLDLVAGRDPRVAKLDPDLVRRGLDIPDAIFEREVRAAGFDLEEMMAVALVRSGDYVGRLLQLIDHAVTSLAKLAKQLRREKLERIRECTREVKACTRRYGETWLQQNCSEVPDHLKFDAPDRSDLLKEFELPRPQAFEGKFKISTPEWTDVFGLLPVSFGEDQTVYRDRLSNDLGDYPGASAFVCALIKFVNDFECYDARADRAHQLLLGLENGPPAKPASYDDVMPPPVTPLRATGAEAEYAFLQLIENRPGVVEIHNQQAQLQRIAGKLHDLLDAEIAHAEEERKAWNDYREAALKLMRK